MFGLTEVAHRILQSREELITELRAELGREPTDDEIRRRLTAAMARAALDEELGRKPT